MCFHCFCFRSGRMECLVAGLGLGYAGSDVNNLTTPALNDTIYNKTMADNAGAAAADAGLGYTTTAAHVYDFLKGVMVPIICVFGMIGNILILVILAKERIKSTVDGSERTVQIGLAALALSDLLFCSVLLPHGIFRHPQFMYKTRSFKLIYRAYSGALINTFILTSTWITVTMATSRYLAICHPFKARHIIGKTGTKSCIALVVLLCILFNIPRLFENQIEQLACMPPDKINSNKTLSREEYGTNPQSQSVIYYINSGVLSSGTRHYTIYIWLYFIFGIFLPLALLAFCNICLVKTLRESSRLRRRYRVPAAHVDSNYRITSILVTIVVMYILLVSPAEVLSFIRNRSADYGAGPALVMAVEITNVLQTLNFAFNFVLYLALNVHFRNAIKAILCNCFRKCGGDGSDDMKLRMPLNRQTSLGQSTTHSVLPLDQQQSRPLRHPSRARIPDHQVSSDSTVDVHLPLGNDPANIDDSSLC